MDLDRLADLPSVRELSWTGDVWAAITTTPSIVLILVLLLLLNRRAGDNALRIANPFRSVKIFGAEFILEERAARQGREEFARYRRQVIEEFELQVDRYRVQQQFEVVALRILEPAFQDCFGLPIGTYRAAVHVEDVLMRESLIQLVDDYPGGGGRGQLKSTRFGLIGVAWRRHQSQTRGPIKEQFDERIDQWGMNQTEAKTVARGKQFFGATLLQDSDNIPIGIFYVDSDAAILDLSEEKQQMFHRSLVRGCEQHGLISSLSAITRDLRGRSPLISIYD